MSTHTSTSSPRYLFYRYLVRASVVLVLSIGVACQSLGNAPYESGPRADPLNVGYGTAAKEEMTGAVGSIDETVIARRAPVNMVELLSGRIAGVQVSRNAAGYSVRVRGAAGEPLFLVDGVPAYMDAWGLIGGLAVQDIAHLEVLKGVTAAMYGARGGNGVIVITTKRAR